MTIISSIYLLYIYCFLLINELGMCDIRQNVTHAIIDVVIIKAFYCGLNDKEVSIFTKEIRASEVHCCNQDPHNSNKIRGTLVEFFKF